MRFVTMQRGKQRDSRVLEGTRRKGISQCVKGG